MGIPFYAWDPGVIKKLGRNGPDIDSGYTINDEKWKNETKGEKVHFAGTSEDCRPVAGLKITVLSRSPLVTINWCRTTNLIINCTF